MGWCNYIVVDKYKLKFEISRYVNVDDVDNIQELIKSIFDEYETIRESDIMFETNHSDRVNNSIKNIGYKIIDLMITSMEEYYFYDYMLMLWLRQRGIDYRVISEYELENKEEPASKYKTISQWDKDD